MVMGDLHIELSDLQECKDIVSEICRLGLQYKCSQLIQLGDLCDRNKLTSEEVFDLTQNVDRWAGRFEKVHIIEGNHDKLDDKHSIIDYLYYLAPNITIHSDEAVISTAFGDVLCGHWFVDKSNGAFGHYKYTVEEIKKKPVRAVFLGHQHDAQNIDDFIFHAGSSRFVDFGESAKPKKVAILSDKITWVELQSPIPLYNVSSIAELDKVPNRAKVRYIFKSFAQLKNEIDDVEKRKDRFHRFKKKLDFVAEVIKPTVSAVRRTPKAMITSLLEDIEDMDVKKALQEEFEVEFK